MFKIMALSLSLSLVIPSLAKDKVRVGYFHGGRTLNVYRAFHYGFFDKENLDVSLVTKTLKIDEYFEVPKKFEDLKKLQTFGKVTGDELLDLMLKGKVDMATVGETSFILAAHKGLPVVAIAELGFDNKKHPGHLIAVRKALVIKKAENLKKLKWASRRSSGGDHVVLLEFFEKMGIDAGKLDLNENISEIKMKKGVKKGKVDAAYFHLATFHKLWEKGMLVPYRPLDWINPEISQSLLVVTKNYYEKNKPLIRRFLKALSKRNQYENSLSEAERIKGGAKHDTKGLQIDKRVLGLYGLPIFRNHPTVRVELLREMERLLIKHHQLVDKPAPLEKFIRNDLVPQK